jgi:hypothetical protein
MRIKALEIRAGGIPSDMTVARTKSENHGAGREKHYDGTRSWTLLPPSLSFASDH